MQPANKSTAGETQPQKAGPGRRIAGWLAASLAAVVLLGIGLSFVADAVPVTSPIATDATVTGALETAQFRLPNIDGGQTGPPDFRGKVVVVELWATWCMPCRQQAKYLEQIHQEYGDRVEILAINSGEDVETVAKFLSKTPFPYSVLLDQEQSVFRRYGLTGLPTVMVIDPAGRIVFMESRVVDTRTLRGQIDGVLGAEGSADSV